MFMFMFIYLFFMVHITTACSNKTTLSNLLNLYPNDVKSLAVIDKTDESEYSVDSDKIYHYLDKVLNFNIRIKNKTSSFPVSSYVIALTTNDENIYYLDEWHVSNNSTTYVFDILNGSIYDETCDLVGGIIL